MACGGCCNLQLNHYVLLNPAHSSFKVSKMWLEIEKKLLYLKKQKELHDDFTFTGQFHF